MNKHIFTAGHHLGDRYEIKRLLGRGGFGITYVAYDNNLKNEIVIKEYFPAEIAGRNNDGNVYAQAVANESLYEEGKKRFLSEARVLASLFEIPGVVKVIDFFEMNNTAYIVMEYVVGVSLRQWLESRDECCSFDEAYMLLRPVMEAMKKAAEEQGITDCEFVAVGCIGLCQYEPIVEVYAPGKEKVTYIKMTPEKATEVVDRHLAKGIVHAKYTLSAPAL